ncbi:MAG: DUF4382 domain-containing protein [Gammaproteobacteria bacterium]|nr:DUF4382 domain-containing protein [Gammaproteobacteria bacterium]
MAQKVTLGWMLVAMLALTGCGAGSNGSGGPQTGKLSLQLIDGPVEEAEAVVVEFHGVSIKPANGSAIDFHYDEPRSFDLLQLQNGAVAPLLDDIELQAGHYEWIRLMVNSQQNVDDTYIKVAGVKHDLPIPSGDQTGLKLNRGFTITAGGHSHFTIDFDLRKSVIQNKPQGYKLKPVLRLVDNVDIGHIGGEVSETVLSDNNCGVTDTVAASVYVYPGLDVTPDDIGSTTEPVATSNVVYSAETKKYSYTVGYLLAGNYTVALTCEAGNDHPEDDDSIAFVNPQNATVIREQHVSVNF